jgi:hypothetical protein
VFVVVDGKANMQSIKVARQVGSQVVVAEGLNAGQQVIVSPPNTLRSESPIELAGAKKTAAKPDPEKAGDSRP